MRTPFTSWRDVPYDEQRKARDDVLKYLENKQVVGHTIDVSIIDWRMVQLFKKKRSPEEARKLPIIWYKDSAEVLEQVYNIRNLKRTHRNLLRPPSQPLRSWTAG